MRAWLVVLAACGRAESPPPSLSSPSLPTVSLAPAAKPASDAGDPIWIAFGRPLPHEWLVCTANADCEVAMAGPPGCWPMAVNKAHRKLVVDQLVARIARGETCAHPGCGIEFHDAECKRGARRLIDGCQDPGGSH